MDISGLLYGTNSPYLEELYAQFQKDPESVPENWRYFFAGLGAAGSVPSVTHDGLARADVSDHQTRVSQLIHAYRTHGHKRAHLNPLDPPPALDDDLKPIAFGLTNEDMTQEFNPDGILSKDRAPLADILDALKKTYCGTIGVQYFDLPNRSERLWLQEQMEQVHNHPEFTKETRKRILKGLLVAERFEQFIHKKFVGAKRFSLEGGESLIPMLDQMIDAAGAAGVTDIVMGMAHRGRLNVLANILEKPLDAIFSEFAGTVTKANDQSSGDVKYHKGKSFDITTNKGYKLHVALLANPSHLEIVNPVVMGSARARQHLKGDIERSKVMPVLIHGDAAFIGQGVVAESLSIGTVPGFNVGGTVHIVINNQVGFTARPDEAFGTEYCTDFARMLQVPIFHVNGDDPEACAHVMRLAMEYRRQFKRDIVIDLVCFRKYGHNEGDDPTFTQPVMYEKIRSHASVLAQYSDKLVADGAVSKKDYETLEADFQNKLDKAYDKAKSDGFSGTPDMFGGVWRNYARDEKAEPKTNVTKRDLEQVSKALVTFPKGFVPNSKIAKLLEKRAETLLAGEMDWGTAENAAYGTLLMEGYNIRLTGQDVKRGTFSHRHAVVWDMNTGKEIMPLATVQAKGTSLEVFSSPLSEEAVLGYEFGYALTDPQSLTIWEAQFGDFVNGAQIVIDQFISSSEAKWHRMAGLVMLLPHGFEGQGPEHSSARLERFLQLCAQNNMTVCNVTTPAQIFHLLRRHMHRKVRRPLIVMSPKSLLRHPKAVSTMADLTQGGFQTVITDNTVKAKDVTRVVLCSGKLYYDLLAGREKEKNSSKVALVRLEQLYPLPMADIKAALKPYGKAELVWAQEEPRNQGSWAFILDNLATELGQTIRYIGRPAAAAPATGSHDTHEHEQHAIVADVFNLKSK